MLIDLLSLFALTANTYHYDKKRSWEILCLFIVLLTLDPYNRLDKTKHV